MKSAPRVHGSHRCALQRTVGTVKHENVITIVSHKRD